MKKLHPIWFVIIGAVPVTAILAVHLVVPLLVPDSHQLALFGQEAFTPLPEGTLIRSEADERVYYVDGDGAKRWITSPEAFSAQGFHAESILTVPVSQIEQYPDGLPVEAHSLLTLPSERGSLPDIAPLAPYQLRLGSVNGRTVIRFTGSFWNQGAQSFHLVPGASATDAAGRAPVYEHIVASDGSVRLKLVGTFTFHPAHHHLHLDDFGYYILNPVRSLSDLPVAMAPFVLDKTTFCMRDDERMAAGLSGVPGSAVFTACGAQGQGVSVGWIDVYPYTLVDQYVDVQDMPPGIYGLSFMLDPEQHYLEGRKDNNIATTFIELDVAHGVLKVLARLAPFPSDKNLLPDGTLVRTPENGNVYVLDGGYKRWLRSVDIFNSYGYAWNAIYPVTRAMSQAIPSQVLVRRQGAQEVFVLNEQGYRRHILNPTVFASYGFVPEAIADVNDAEFDAYAPGDLLMHGGDDQVYLISGTTKRAIGTLSTLQSRGYDLRGLFTVNETDFNAYTLAAGN
jgi:hypothetical protein